MLSRVLSLLMILAIITVALILFVSLRSKEKYLQAYRMTNLSVTYLCPVLYAVLFVMLRLYLSLPLIALCVLLFRKVEAKELDSLAGQYKLPSDLVLKKASLLRMGAITLGLMLAATVLLYVWMKGA